MNNLTTSIEKDVLLTRFSDFPFLTPNQFDLPKEGELMFGEDGHPDEKRLQKDITNVINPVIRIQNLSMKDDGIYGDVVFLNKNIETEYKNNNYRFSFRAQMAGSKMIIYTWDAVEKHSFNKMLGEISSQFK